MIITKLALPRRTFLRGLGATLALPMLDAMVPAIGTERSGHAGEAPRLRVHPDGIEHHRVDAQERRPLTELSPTLAR